MNIKYDPCMRLELWVWDSGELEGFSVYVNGELADRQHVSELKYALQPPDPHTEIVVEFAGTDGGATKIVDVAEPREPVTLEHCEHGQRHVYLLSNEA